MTFKSKRTLCMLVLSLILLGGYIAYALRQNLPAGDPGTLRAWALTMLTFIGISVAAVIAMNILFHIVAAVGISVKEHAREDHEVERIISATVAEDEMDQRIELKSSRIGYAFAGTSFVAALIGLAVGASAVCALHIAFGGFYAGAFAEGVMSIYWYERGV